MSEHEPRAQQVLESRTKWLTDRIGFDEPDKELYHERLKKLKQAIRGELSREERGHLVYVLHQLLTIHGTLHSPLTGTHANVYDRMKSLRLWILGSFEGIG